MLEKILTKLFGIRCSHCRSRDTHWGYYSRGWNNLCQQAHGSDGHWCGNCYKISFRLSTKEYRHIIPDWCDVVR